MNTTQSQQLQQRAQARIPGGVDSPVRSFRSVGGVPRWIVSGAGPYMTDADGNRYVDCICSWGALLLGHAPPAVVQALGRAAAAGASFGASTPAELELAEAVHARMPHLELLRFVNSGTEAAMSAVRVARGFTGRDRVLKFAGGYHGHGDLFLANAGSGVATLGLAASAGVPAGAVRDTITVDYNSLEQAAQACERHPGEIACIIVEPVAGNMGCVPPAPGFLQGLRDLAGRHGALLIFDEVMSGFRVERGGAAARYGVRPDLAVLGKIIGGGLPVGAYGGRAEVMGVVAPLGPVYQAGTLSGNPLAMAAGVATLAALTPEAYALLEQRGARLEAGLKEALAAAAVAGVVQRVGAMLTLFFTAREAVGNFADAQSCDTAAFSRFHGALLERGVMWPPSQFEAAFFGLSHGEREIDLVIAAVREALRAV